jgi:hypothetical protein
MWVRFLDKKSEGTLFNFGNPLEATNALHDLEYFGFTLDTLVDDMGKRFVRLLVREGDYPNTRLYDSHTGVPGYDKIDTTDSSTLDSINIIQYTQIPTDFSEWYFICANYNPDIDEENSILTNQIKNYWLNHIDETGEYVTNSGLGNRAKVEFISRSDLLRARGYKV